MTILLVAVVGLIIAAMLALWPSAGRDRSRDGRLAGTTGGDLPRVWRGGGHARETVPEPARSEPGRQPSSLEGVLVDQLIKGDISRRQYVRALERIAARDEERHPMSVPRDDHPGACA